MTSNEMITDQAATVVELGRRLSEVERELAAVPYAEFEDTFR